MSNKTTFLHNRPPISTFREPAPKTPHYTAIYRTTTKSMLTARGMPSTNSLCDDGLEDQPSKREGNCRAHHVSEAPNAVTVLRVCVRERVIPVDSGNGFCMRKSHRLRHPGHMRRATPANIRRTFLAKSRANKANPNLGYEIGTEIDEKGWKVARIRNAS